jgi:hypothetical protein
VAEIDSQIRLTRAQPGATGNVHFSMRAFTRNQGGISDSLRAGLYAEPALVPATPWLGGRAPAAPRVALRTDRGSGRTTVGITPVGDAPARVWVVQARYDALWVTDVVGGATREHLLRPPATRGAPDEVRVYGVDRLGAAGPAATAER